MAAIKRRALARFSILVLAASAPLGAAPTASPSAATNFQIGSGQGLCSAQDNLQSAARANVFDRSWTIICRDATRPVGLIHMLRGRGISTDRIAKGRIEALDCEPVRSETVRDLGNVSAQSCRSRVSEARWTSYVLEQGGRTYVVEGATAYDEALRVALRSVALDRAIDEPIAIPVLDPGAGGSYYRLQANAADPAARLQQGYRSNNSGSFAEAVEFFEFDGGEIGGGATGDQRNLRHEMLINRALQLSNLGKFAEADATFAEARALRVTDPVQARLARNLEAMNEINQRVLDLAQGILDLPMPPPESIASETGGATTIAERISMPLGSSAKRSGAIALQTGLTPAERAALLDAQAAQLSGTVQRLRGRNDLALAKLDQALFDATNVGSGRATASYRLRAQIMTEKALLLESMDDLSGADRMLREVRSLIATEYPDSQATLAATAGLAAFLARHDRKDEALALYHTLADQLIGSRTQLVGLTRRVTPYFDLLTERIPATPAYVTDLWAMSQTLGRPGAASTLEQLSRSMASGDDTGSALFRQSIALKRDIERARIQIAQLTADQASGGADHAIEIGQLQDRVEQLSAQQLATLDQLSAYPQFRAIETGVLAMPDMLALLKPDEAYMKIAAIGDNLYAVYLSHDRQTGWKLPISAGELADKVSLLRDSISLTINGVQSTFPFDVDAARALYLDLFAPVEADLKKVGHLIFEPDSAMLKLPVNLLIASQDGVDAYHARMEQPDADDYDFRGIDWLGRTHSISTALSAASFRDLRSLPPSTAQRAYLGLGHNQPVSPSMLPASAMRLRGGSDDSTACNWPLDAWNNPIADTELRAAAAVYGGNQADLLTGPGFTDTAILNRGDLSQFKVIHFATHGLVDAPRKSCPARPALLTSFGTEGSDGLLEFREIFDLHLNADLVVLSACDTAGGASAATTREAGIETGGGTALDGLVRAFIGAGSRTVVASHWPAPDDYDATFRLMRDFLGAPPGTSQGEALRRAEIALMDDAATSHPFYWSGFALIGDGAQPLPQR